MMAASVLIVLFNISCVLSHGRLMDPPARNSMWRMGYPNPINHKDNELWCGGFDVQWNHNGGNCGVCGDAFNSSIPRPHETGGFYANGFIGRAFTPGQTIEVEIELTSNHKGFFELRLCPLSNSLPVRETQSCFDRYPLYLENKSTYRFDVPEDSARYEIFKYRVTLPDEVTCSHCVIQWTHTTNQTKGICEDGTEAMGCGNQETYVNCADITITQNAANFWPSSVISSHFFARPTESIGNLYGLQDHEVNANQGPLARKPFVLRSSSCFGRSYGSKVILADLDAWCTGNCLSYPPICPKEMCQCVNDCVPTKAYAKARGADTFCHEKCLGLPRHESCSEMCDCS